MAVNPNRFSGQPTYSRDVTGLMRRINALEARANLQPSGSYFIAYDYDIYNGRVYVLVQRNFGIPSSDPIVWRIQVYSTSSGEFLYSFAVPEDLRFSFNGGYGNGQRAKAQPKICVGDDYIFMPARNTAVYRDATTGFGGMYRFSLVGDNLEYAEFDGFETIITTYNGNTAIEIPRNYPFGPTFGSIGESYQDPRDLYYQMQFADGYVVAIYALAFWDQSTDITSSAPPENNVQYCNSLCVAKSDFSKLWTKLDFKEPFDKVYANPWYSIGPPVHSYSHGGCALYDGKIYFDAGGELQSPADLSPYWASIDLNDDDIAHPTRLRSSIDPYLTRIQKINGTYANALSLPGRYQTNGNYLYSVEQYLDGSVNRSKIVKRDFASGAFVEQYTDLALGRIKDGILWTSSGTVLQARDPDTFALILEFNIGDARKQTEWFGFSTSAGTSLGTPDSGVSVPTDDALTTYKKSAGHIIEMREALQELAPSFRSPTGDAFNLEGTEDETNLYYVALGDRAKYGATDGARTTWTRDENQMTWTAQVTTDTGTYVCIKEHRATANNQPGVGGQWRTYWREFIPGVDVNPTTAWELGKPYGLHKTYDIDIGEVDECVAILEGAALTTDSV